MRIQVRRYFENKISNQDVVNLFPKIICDTLNLKLCIFDIPSTNDTSKVITIHPDSQIGSDVRTCPKLFIHRIPNHYNGLKSPATCITSGEIHFRKPGSIQNTETSRKRNTIDIQGNHRDPLSCCNPPPPSSEQNHHVTETLTAEGEMQKGQCHLQGTPEEGQGKPPQVIVPSTITDSQAKDMNNNKKQSHS